MYSTYAHARRYAYIRARHKKAVRDPNRLSRSSVQSSFSSLLYLVAVRLASLARIASLSLEVLNLV
jgi:hypothetical protein